MTLEDVGPHFEKNSLKLDNVSKVEWEIALRKAKKHLSFRLWNRTKFGAHTSENLGVPPMEYYLNYAYTGIIMGDWEWKDEFDLPKQLIRIIDSRISTVVESYRQKQVKNEERAKDGKYKLTTKEVPYDVEATFYYIEAEEGIDEELKSKIESQYTQIEQFVSKIDDEEIKTFWDCVKDGWTRADIAELIGKTPKQLDKVKERFLRQIKKVVEIEDGIK